MSWDSIIKKVCRKPYHRNIKVEKWEVSHPKSSGFYKSTGDINGQNADYRKCLTDGSSIHVLEYDNYYLVHRDRADPDKYPIVHLILDATPWAILIGVAGFLLYNYVESK